MRDLDGDGRNEIALIDDRNLWIYRWENEFKLLKKLSGNEDRMTIWPLMLGISTKMERRRSLLPIWREMKQRIARGRLSSFVVAYKDGDYRVVASDLDWYLTLWVGEKEGRFYWGKRRDVKTGFEGPIYEMGWNGKGIQRHPQN